MPQPLRDLGRIRAALLALDTGDLAGAKERAQPLNNAGNPWRYAAREAIGTADYQAGDLQAARDAFTGIQQDAETPQDLWVDLGLMVSLIDSQLAAPETKPSGDAAKPAANAPAGATKPEASKPAAGQAAGSQGAPPAELPVPSEGHDRASDNGDGGRGPQSERCAARDDRRRAGGRARTRASRLFARSRADAGTCSRPDAGSRSGSFAVSRYFCRNGEALRTDDHEANSYRPFRR